MTTIGSSTPTYDANGNVTNDFLHTYAWDAEGRPVTIDGVGMTYDALGRGVELNNSGVHTETQYSPTGFKMQLLNGQTLVKGFVPMPAGTAEVWTASANYYRHADWLGSARLTSNQNRTIYGDVAYAPFGETYAQSGTADASFTGMNQDTVSNEYDFSAREYGIQGRWPSPDPAGIGAVDPANPQSWNRYSYALNNPLALTDPTGLFVDGGGGCDFFDPFCGDPCFWDPFLCADPCWFFDCGGGGGWPLPPLPPAQAPPAPPGGYGAGIDPYGTWDEKLPAGVQVFPSPIPGLRQLPGSSNCDWCGDSFTIQLNRVTRITPGSWLNPYLWRGIWSSIQGTNAKLGENVGISTDVISPELAACLAKKNLPIGLATAASQGTDWTVGEVLARIGLTGVKKAGPYAMAGTYVGSVIGCAKQLAPGVGPG